MAVQQTWDSLAQFIASQHSREGAKEDRALYLELANEALGILAEQIGPLEVAWNNAAGGGLTLTGLQADLPIECIEVLRVEWDGTHNKLPFRSQAWLDREKPGWRDDIGEPQYHTRTGTVLLLDSTPVLDATGKLVVRGTSYLPPISPVPGAVNPLIHLPTQGQRALTYYVLAHLPPTPTRDEKGNEVINPASIGRAQFYDTRWQTSAKATVTALARRKYEPFTY